MTQDVTAEELKPAIEYLTKTNTEAQKENDEWAGYMVAECINGVDTFTGRQEVINSITVEDIRNFMRDMLARGQLPRGNPRPRGRQRSRSHRDSRRIIPYSIHTDSRAAQPGSFFMLPRTRLPRRIFEQLCRPIYQNKPLPSPADESSRIRNANQKAQPSAGPVDCRRRYG